MQQQVTTTRDHRLLAAATAADRNGAVIGWVLRQSRLEVRWEQQGPTAEELSLVMGATLAHMWESPPVLVGRLTVPDDGAYESIVDDYDTVRWALREVAPELDSVELVEAPADDLPAADPDAAVRPCEWRGLWFRSNAERRIAEALEAENVLFIPNASVRLGVTPDHRDTIEPDFLILHDGKLGILEVDGPWHDGRADQDHERDRRFQEHGVGVVQRYRWDECSETPGLVVTGFLRLLSLNG